PVEAALQVRQPAQRRAVGPVDVVDRDQRRPAERQVRGDPVQPVQRGEGDAGRVVVVRVELTDLEQGRGARSRTVEQLLPFLRRGRGQERLEQLADDAVRELVLELAAAGRENREAGPGRRGPRLENEPRLADAGTALNGDEATVSAHGGVDVRLDRGEL